jgi:hypothetical protein
MFRKTHGSSVCDNVCRAAKLREDALLKAALQGPRL